MKKLEIINSNFDIEADENKVLTMRLTHSQKMQVVKELEDGEILTVNNFVIFEDVKESETVEVLSMETDKGIFCTNSSTFKESFLYFYDCTGLPLKLEKISGVTKNGREFVNCEYTE